MSTPNPPQTRDLPRITVDQEAVDQGRLTSLQLEGRRQFGNVYWTDFQLRDSSTSFLTLIGPEAAKIIYQTHRTAFSHDLGWSPIFARKLGYGLLNMDEPAHGTHRSAWAPAFMNDAIQLNYRPIFLQTMDSLLDSWIGEPSVPVLSEMRRMTFACAAKALAGIASDEDVASLSRSFHDLVYSTGEGLEPMEGLLKKEMSEEWIEDFFGRHVESKRRWAGPPRDVLDGLLQADSDGRLQLDLKQIIGHMNILLFAGHETTTSLCTYALVLLSQRSDLCEKLRQEIEKSADLSSLLQNPYIDAFVRELGRYYAPVLNVPRGVTSDVTIEGYPIQAGTPVMLGLAASMRLPEIFSDPEQFDPERFLDPRREDVRTPSSLLTFGSGPRTCIGKKFASEEIKLFLARLLTRFEFEVTQTAERMFAGLWISSPPEAFSVRVRIR
jgi:cytochrome P450